MLQGRRSRIACVTLLALLLVGGSQFSRPAWAQSGANTGQIVGVVVDASGAAAAGAAVTIRNPQTNLTRTTTTDSAGRYAVSSLPLGPYTVGVALSGFEAPAQQATIALGSSVSANFKLALAGVTGSVNVTAQASELESTRTASKSTLTELQIHNLPSNGRRVQNFVTDTPTALIEPECRGFSVSGQKGIYASVSIDGGDYDGAWSCGLRGRSESGPTFGLEALQEVQVVRSGFNAEFGRSTGGVIQMSTRSGTNRFNGSAYEYFRDGGLSAQDAFDRSPIASVHQFGASIGGPIAKDRTFFFTAPEFQVGSKPVQVIYPVLDSQNLRGTAGAAALLGVAPEGGFDAISNSQSVITRVDHRLSDRDMLLGRFDFTRNLQTNAPGANSLSTGLGIASTSTSAASNQVTQPDDNYTAIGQWTSALSNHFLNELRVQYAREVRPRVHLGAGPQVTVNNAGSPVALYGTAPEGSWGNVGFSSTDNRAQFVDNVSIVSGAHTAKIGIDYQRISGRALYDQNAGGAYTFNSLADLLNRTPAIYTQFTGSGSIDLTLDELAFYIQDEWRVLPGVTISPGLRYEAQFNPGYYTPSSPNRYPLATAIPDDTAMIDPRLGLAWDVGNKGTTVVRAGGGLYHAPTYMSLFAQSILFNGGNPDRAYSVSVNNPAALANAFQSVGVNLANAPLDTLPVFTADQFARLLGAGSGLNAVSYFDPDFRNPRALQWQTGIERRLARGITVSEQFTYINTTQVARERDTNLGAPVVDATGRNIYSNPRPLPAFGVSQVTESAGRSLYKGFTTTLNIRRGPATLDVYYTPSWNRSYDDVERGFTSVRYADVNNIASEYNFSNIDEPHQFLVNGNVFLPYQFALGTVMRFTSGRPFNAVAGTDLNRDGQNTDRPIVDGVMLPRNAFRNVGYKNIDLRIQKTFAMPGRRGTLSIVADLLNTFNFANVQLAGAALTYGAGTVVQNGALVAQAPPAAFGQLKNAAGQYYQYNVAGDPLQAQIGVRFQF
jgi:hypothetical protein